MWTEAERGEVYAALESSVGTRVATLLTQSFPPVEWEALARRSDLEGLARRDELLAQGVALRGEMAQIRGELKSEIAQLRGEVAEVKGELHALPARLFWGNVALAVTVAGFVLAATRLG